MRTLIAPLIVLAAAACGSSGGSVSTSDGAAPSSGCSRSCIFQYRDVSVCNELQRFVQDGPWLDNCVDQGCETWAFDPTTPGDPYASMMVPCTSTREYRFVQTRLGPCNSSTVASVLATVGDAGGKVDDAVCGADTECLSKNCVALDGQNYVCAEPCSGSGCAQDLACLDGFCLPSCLRP